jgi:hypothetical protein
MHIGRTSFEVDWWTVQVCINNFGFLSFKVPPRILSYCMDDFHAITGTSASGNNITRPFPSPPPTSLFFSFPFVLFSHWQEPVFREDTLLLGFPLASSSCSVVYSRSSQSLSSLGAAFPHGSNYRIWNSVAKGRQCANFRQREWKRVVGHIFIFSV